MIGMLLRLLALFGWAMAATVAGLHLGRAFARSYTGAPPTTDLAEALTYLGLALPLAAFAFPVLLPALDLLSATGFGLVVAGAALTVRKRRRHSNQEDRWRA